MSLISSFLWLFCIIGETSAGKSSLINKLTNVKLFKTSNIPSTDKIYRVHSSNEIRLKCTSEDGKVILNDTYTSMSSLQTDVQNSPTSLQGYRYADIYLPNPIIKVIVIIFNVYFSTVQNNYLLHYM